jgi:hypothetical protein
MGLMHHANGKLPLVAAAAPNHTPPYESSIQSKSPEYGGNSNAGYLNNDCGAKPGLVASERATVVTIEREGTVDNKPPPEVIHEPGGLETARLDWNWQEERNLLSISKSNLQRLATSLSEMILNDNVFHLRGRRGSRPLATSGSLLDI